VIGFVGVILVNLNGTEGLSGGFALNGEGFLIIACAAYALSSIFIKVFSQKENPVIISGYQFILGGALMCIGALSFGGRVNLSDMRGVLVLLYLALLSAVAYSVWGILLKYNPVSRVTVFTFMTPVFGVLLSLLMLTENSTVEPVNLVLCLILVSLGIFTLNYQKQKKDIGSEVSETGEASSEMEKK
jgi:drug/metabolite transporter (DMT)-like permease